MFLVPAFSLLSAIGRDPFAVSSRLCGTSAGPELPLPASGLSFEQKGAKPRESCQASQNEHLQKSSYNFREMSTYKKIIELKAAQNENLHKSGPGGHRRERNGHQELRGVNKVGRGEGYHEAWSNQSRRSNSFAITSLCKRSVELPWNDIVNQKGGGAGVLF